MKLDSLRRVADEFAAFGREDAAAAVREAARRAEDTWQAWWNEPLSIAEAASFGGYSVSQLRRLVRSGTVRTAPDGGIRRRHIPIQPGHEPPLGLEPAALRVASLADAIAKRRTG